MYYSVTVCNVCYLHMPATGKVRKVKLKRQGEPLGKKAELNGKTIAIFRYHLNFYVRNCPFPQSQLTRSRLSTTTVATREGHYAKEILKISSLEILEGVSASRVLGMGGNFN